MKILSGLGSIARHELTRISIVPIQTKYYHNRHRDPKYRLERSREVWKVDLPDFDQARIDQKIQSPEEARTKLKEKGVTPTMPWGGREMFLPRTMTFINPEQKHILSRDLTMAGAMQIGLRQFHAAGSKVHYLDFRHRFRTNHLRLHLLIIRRQKMKKHKRRKFRRKYKCLLAKRRLKREVAKEKAFRVELLTMIRRAEQFDPREYAIKKINEVRNRPKVPTPEEKFDEIKELVRIHRFETHFIKPKHRRLDD